jgi:glucan biosynthesis protein
VKVHVTSLYIKNQIYKPNVDEAKFLKLLKDSGELLWDGCTTHSKLSTIAWVFTIKPGYGLSKANYDNIIE